MEKQQAHTQALRVIDILIINIGLVSAFYILYPKGFFFANILYLNLLLFYNINWLFSTVLTKAYRSFKIRKIDKSIKRLARALLLHILLVSAFTLWLKGHFYPLNVLVLSYVIILFLLIIWRTLHFFYQIRLRKKGHYQRNVVIVGTGETAQEFGEYLRSSEQIGYHLLGFFDEGFNSKKEVIGDIDNLKGFIVDNKVDEIYCSIPNINDKKVQELMDFSVNKGIRLNLIPEIRSYYYSKSKIDFIGQTPVLVLKDFPLDNDANLLMKRVFDLVFSSLIIVLVFSWLFPILAILIKFESKGAIFYVQQRSGKGNKAFSCLKFRSMRQNGGVENKFKQATKDDPRITKIGAFIRKTSIDELPQFLNVFLGNMSVVGPRPHPIGLDDQYREEVYKYMSRHFVKPGITGLSQVMGYRGETKENFDMKARINLDNFYIENWSFFLDIRVILLTVYRVLFKKEENAY